MFAKIIINYFAIVMLIVYEVDCRDRFPCKFDSSCVCVYTEKTLLRVDCAGKNITVIPLFPGNVENVSLANNRIQSVENGVFKYNSQLLFLDLSKNEIYQLASESFQGLFNLQTLIINNNNISSTVSQSNVVFEPLVALRYLDMKNNSNTGFAFNVSSLTNLETLKIDFVDGETYFGTEYKALRNLTNLDLSGYSGHCLMKILTPGTFEYLSNVQHLDLSKCRINFISSGAFKNLSYLDFLDLSDNRCLEFTGIINVTNDLPSTSIKVLRINKIHQTFALNTELLKCHIKNLRNTNIIEIHLDSNRLQLVEPGVLKMLPKTLKRVSIADNQFTYGEYLLDMFSVSVDDVNISYMGMSHYLKDMDEQCDTISLGGSSCGREPDIDQQSIKEINKTDSLQTYVDDQFIPIFIPHQLKRIHFRQCKVRYYFPKLSLSNNLLEYIDASFNTFYDWRGPILNLKHLKFLDLSNNFCSNVSKIFFIGGPNLTTLLVQNNLLGFVLPDDHTGETFAALTILKTLNLADNRIPNLPVTIFKSQKNLRTLNLSGNMLENVNFEMIHMTKLSNIDISDNRLSLLEVSFTKQLDDLTKHVRHLTVDMSGNPIKCTCDSIDFIKWLTTTKVVLLYKFQQECSSMKMYLNDSLTVYDQLRKKCSSYATTIVAVASWVVIFAVAIIGGLLYRYRWKIRYLYYIVKSKHQGYIKPMEVDNDYLYDAFISYADDDDMFVYSKFLKHVEEEGHIICCVHKRDFIPGKEIATNITSAIHNSRKTVVVMSHNFLASRLVFV
ncbi:TLR13 [Mytilus coruscus]|uniref:TLR13 n=1 Tax=Mytilus coruscus TaxID=42192 RepID=A0A6J8D896_MYTCO|nr:TLR13 [Mytilus coruscus]